MVPFQPLDILPCVMETGTTSFLFMHNLLSESTLFSKSQGLAGLCLRWLLKPKKPVYLQHLCIKTSQYKWRWLSFLWLRRWKQIKKPKKQKQNCDQINQANKTTPKKVQNPTQNTKIPTNPEKDNNQVKEADIQEQQMGRGTTERIERKGEIISVIDE